MCSRVPEGVVRRIFGLSWGYRIFIKIGVCPYCGARVEYSPKANWDGKL